MYLGLAIDMAFAYRQGLRQSDMRSRFVCLRLPWWRLLLPGETRTCGSVGVPGKADADASQARVLRDMRVTWAGKVDTMALRTIYGCHWWVRLLPSICTLCGVPLPRQGSSSPRGACHHGVAWVSSLLPLADSSNVRRLQTRLER